jgi:hypothetical protein
MSDRFADTTRTYAFEGAPGDGLVTLAQDPEAPRSFHLGGALAGIIEARRWADAHRAMAARAAEAGFGAPRLVSLSRRERLSMTEAYKTEDWKAQVRAMREDDEGG